MFPTFNAGIALFTIIKFRPGFVFSCMIIDALCKTKALTVNYLYLQRR